MTNNVKEETMMGDLLNDISNTILEFESEFPNKRVVFSDYTFRSSAKIFFTVLLSKMYEYQEREKMSLEKKMALAEYAGGTIRQIVKQLTGTDFGHDA